MQDALGDCGWEEARKVKQQDVSEAFTFITDQLALPLLTLKMDVYHTGKDDQADHRIVRERILEVAIPKPPPDGSGIKLEECLESYFNNRVEIKRHLARRNTLQGSRPPGLEKVSAQTDTTNLGSATDSKGGFFDSCCVAHLVLTMDADDTSSIFSQRLDSSGLKRHENGTVDDIKVHPGRPLAGNFRKEVLMPAWQFFNLIRQS